uniref:Rho guanine nucleotide exchange factor 11-like n=1 Tax=Saccoglossus kowalevskii TaxID=10224 RepID=A0ABM0MNL5_SACKO|nr:PREDICTED: rho guanine nucleotide exchange factor 11-like [Saccoglossus kowalevskii]
MDVSAGSSRLAGLSDDAGERRQSQPNIKYSPPQQHPSHLVAVSPDYENQTRKSDPYGQLIQRCVIVQRDEKGYGLTVSGDNPVFVQSVKENGAAYKAGVQQGDRIIKVNGTLVTQSNHIEVVKLIKSGSYVALTLLGRPPGSNYPPLPPPHVPAPPAPYTGRPEVTGPQPAVPEKDEELRQERINVMRQMLDQEMELFQTTKDEYDRNPSDKIKRQLDGGTTRIKALEQQLRNLTGDSMSSKDDEAPYFGQPPAMEGGFETITEQQGNASEQLLSEVDYYEPASPEESKAVDNDSLDGVPDVLRENQIQAHSSADEDDEPIPFGIGPTEARESKAQQSASDGEVWVKNTIKYNPAPWLKDGPDHKRHKSDPERCCQVQSDLPGSGTKIKRNLSDAADKESKRHAMSSGNSDPSVNTDAITAVDFAVRRHSASSDKVARDSDSDHEVSSEAVSPVKQHHYEEVLLQDTIDTSPSNEDAQMDHAENPNLVTSPVELPLSPSEEIQSPTSPQSTEVVLQRADVNNVDSYMDTAVTTIPPSSTNQQIVSMEDDEFESDNEQVIDHGPFISLDKLEKKPAHIAVLLHYLISNSDPSSMFFYIVTDGYSNGSPKEMRKWAYEIYSTFLADQAVTFESMVPNDVLESIGIVLANKIDNSDAMRSIFVLARAAAAVDIRYHLEDFRSKRALGLGTLYGDQQLSDLMDRNTEIQIVEQTLMPHLDRLSACDTFSNILWSGCEQNIHKGTCLSEVQHQCSGKRKKEKSKILPRIPRRTSENSSKASMYGQPPYSPTVKEALAKSQKDERQGFIQETHNSGMPWYQTSHVHVSPPNIHSLPEQEEDDLKMLKDSQKVGKLIKDLERGKGDSNQDLQSPGTPREGSPELMDSERQEKATVKRSGSLRTQEDTRKRMGSGHEGSKRSKSDVDMDVAAVTNATSSLTNSSSSISAKSQDSSTLSEEYDSDMEAETDPPAWQTAVDRDLLKKLKPKEIKRQEVINELFHTEKSHVRNLKILDRVFMKPMQQEHLAQKEFIQLLFPNLEDLLEMHISLNNAMKKERKTCHTIDEVGDILLARFDGEEGESLKEACAIFCRHQSLALDLLKAKQKKDDKLARFLADAENNPNCRRLQLKDFIPCVFQRLTKYPMLLESILKYTSSSKTDHAKVSRARDCCKSILGYVNIAVRDAENQIRLQEMVKKTDKSPFEKSNNTLITEFKNIDLNSRKLLHDGPLIWRLGRAKSIDLHVLLLEDILVLLQKDDNRFVLKCHSSTVQTVKEEVKNTHSPIVKLTNLLCRNVATDKKAFFLVSTSPMGPQIYELVAGTNNERKVWSEIITRTVDGMKNKDKRGTNITPVPSQLPPPPPYSELNEAVEEKLKTKSRSETEKINEKNKSDSLDRLDNILEIQNPPELIDPAKVVVVNHPSMDDKTETVMPPREKLKQVDETIQKALVEKSQIIAELLGAPLTPTTVDQETNPVQEYEPKDLVHAMMQQSNRLTTTVNEHMNLLSNTEQSDSA